MKCEARWSHKAEHQHGNERTIFFSDITLEQYPQTGLNWTTPNQMKNME